MSNQVISQINQVKDCSEDYPITDILTLIRQLNSADSFVCMQAREALTCLDKSVIPELLAALDTANTQLRWQIIKVLESINDPSTIPTLVDQLKNEHAGVRWAASNALIGFRRQAMPALLQGLTRNFDSLWFRQSAHHILHVMHDDGLLYEGEEKVFEALEGIEPGVAVAWAAEKALEILRVKK
jgi:HEAT repeat protein